MRGLSGRYTFGQWTSPFLHQGLDTGFGVRGWLIFASSRGAAMGARNGAARDAVDDDPLASIPNSARGAPLATVAGRPESAPWYSPRLLGKHAPQRKNINLAFYTTMLLDICWYGKRSVPGKG